MSSLPLPIAAFFAGLISFLSPCVLPLVPGYVSMISGAGLDELKGAGLVDATLSADFAVPVPSDDPTLRDDEEPLEPEDLDLGLAPPAERSEE